MHRRGGFTLIEMIVSIAIIAILVLGGSSSILNSIEVRALDNAARDILSVFQQAKWLAAGNKLSNRVRFVNDSGVWSCRIETQTASGTWTAAPKTTIKNLPTRFSVGLNLPADSSVIFDPLGFITGYDSTLNTITLTSAKLGLLSQLNRRTVTIFASGSVRMTKGSA